MLQKAKTKVLPIVLVLACLVGVVGSTMSASGASTTSGDTHYQIVNEPKHTIKFYKCSSYDGTFLSGATYTVKGTSDSGEEVDLTATSDALGLVEFMVSPGTYTVSETSAPDGYNVDPEEHVLKVYSGNDYFTISGMEKKANIYGQDGQSYCAFDIPKASGHVTVTKVWNDGTDSSSVALQDLTIALQTKVQGVNSAGYTVTFDANGGHFGTDTTKTANTAVYAVEGVDGAITHSPVQGSYIEPTNSDDLPFGGWATTPDATTSNVTFSEDGVPSIPITEDTTLYAVWSKAVYVVQIYGINQDGDNTITFGPALGYVGVWAAAANKYEDIQMTEWNFPELATAYPSTTYKNELLKASSPTNSAEIAKTGVRHLEGAGCIYNDSWETIIKNIESGNADIYDDCLKYGCTTQVALQCNNFSITKDDIGKSSSQIKLAPAWNPQNNYASTAAGGWSASYIRAYLNGADNNTTEDPSNYGQTVYSAYCNDTSSYAVDNLISSNGGIVQDSTTSVYSALIAGTPALNGHIVKKAVKSLDNMGNTALTSSDLGTKVQLDTTYDYLWLFSLSELYDLSNIEITRPADDMSLQQLEGDLYQRSANMHISAAYSDDTFATDYMLPYPSGVTINARSSTLLSRGNSNGGSFWTLTRTPETYYYNNHVYSAYLNNYNDYGVYYHNQMGLAPGFVVGGSTSSSDTDTASTTITYDANGSTFDGTATTNIVYVSTDNGNTTVSAGTYQTPELETFSAGNYSGANIFAGWSEDPNADLPDVEVDENGLPTTLLSSGKTDITLYAVYIAEVMPPLMTLVVTAVITPDGGDDGTGDNAELPDTLASISLEASSTAESITVPVYASSYTKQYTTIDEISAAMKKNNLSFTSNTRYTGSQTVVGESLNTYTGHTYICKAGKYETNVGDFTLAKEQGLYLFKEQNQTVTECSKVYDGTPLTFETFTITGPVDTE